jgi:hypothetical protein
MMSTKCRLFLIAIASCLGTSGVYAQTATGIADKAENCDKRAAKEKVDWAKSGPHYWVASDFDKQRVETGQTWCHIWATNGYDRLHKGEDFGRVLLTGEGLHPTVGSIVPNSGFAGGLALNLNYAAKSYPVRFSGSAEARGSANGFWEAGGTLDLLGSGKRLDDRHIDVSLSAIHRALPQLDYFGLGNSSSLANESLFGVADTTVSASGLIPLPKGFQFLARLEGLWTAPQGFHGSTTPSIEQIFTPADTPALNSSTAYFVYGVGINWKHPVDECLQCWYKTDFTGTFRSYVEGTGGPYSFRRLNVTWIQVFTPFPQSSVDLGTISITGRLVESFTGPGNQVPFYLQPTIGGTDINNFDVLRSYRDYRFRAPNALTFQAEYARKIVDPVGVLLFYDVGKVALAGSDLDISHMKHSFGVGLALRAGNSVVFKVYYAWGGREGSHTTYTGNTNNFAADPNLRGVF